MRTLTRPLPAQIVTALTVTQTYTKAFYVGEFDWSASTDSDLTSFLSGFEPITTGISGDLFWNLFAHADQHGWLTRGDHYNLYYPYDVGSDMAVRDQILRTHAFTMSNTLPMPADGVPQAPQITSVVTVTIGSTKYYGVYWRGAEPAQTYVLSRSVMGPPYSWQTICTTCTDSLDQSVPFTDTIPPAPPVPPATAYYENGGLNRASVAGPLSPVYTAP